MNTPSQILTLSPRYSDQEICKQLFYSSSCLIWYVRWPCSEKTGISTISTPVSGSAPNSLTKRYLINPCMILIVSYWICLSEAILMSTTTYSGTSSNGHLNNSPLHITAIFLISRSAVLLYSRTSMAQTSLGPWKIVRDMGSSSHWGLIIGPGQEANSNDLGKSFRFSTQ